MHIDLQMRINLCAHTSFQYGTTKPIDLKPNGGDIPVTNDNRKEFVALYVDWLLNKSVAKQFESFSRGFHRMCGGKTLDLCIPEELELLICGSPELDFTALQENAMYDDGYTRDCVVIQWFWLLVEGFDEDKKKQLLNFVTGSDRVPINGLANMTFIIQRNGPDSDRLPTALTCFSRLLLPEYSTYAKLKDRISVAIENGKGFGLV
ncbi:hypothetical protein SARC_04028 [Sphaeroforma arctica JP610]|uniref:HECT-type E3 ubiquitin transferase n=1 Tax=Sphaeroforma arctica JP610 TaxID=667725 RepID=A0A0L0G687_9EUKA|nr:hypothetical protein SARC_04028 [Sphaeroforma arctica JP610]KNC83723.1 hypothetical protein SARC_04028 [Sphaeroforma arctica JP610]|eukprot:XP_014157625.1 hypothetical protein SARC_04028 [Sphaeroforma arctica JP610]